MIMDVDKSQDLQGQLTDQVSGWFSSSLSLQAWEPEELICTPSVQDPEEPMFQVKSEAR